MRWAEVSWAVLPCWLVFERWASSSHVVIQSVLSMRWRMCRLTKKTTVKFKCGKVQVEYFWAITLPSLHSDMDDDKKIRLLEEKWKWENEKVKLGYKRFMGKIKKLRKHRTIDQTYIGMTTYLSPICHIYTGLTPTLLSFFLFFFLCFNFLNRMSLPFQNNISFLLIFSDIDNR